MSGILRGSMEFGMQGYEMEGTFEIKEIKMKRKERPPL